MKIVIKKVLGIILIIVGLIALFTPFTPGSWLALIGLELLGIRQLIFRKFLNPRQRAQAESFMKKIKFFSKKQPGDKTGNKIPDKNA